MSQTALILSGPTQWFVLVVLVKERSGSFLVPG